MTDNQSLRDALRPVARAVRTASERQKEAAVFAAFDAAGGVKPEALQRSLPPSMVVWWLPGTITAGSNVSAEIPLAGNIRLVDLALRAKTPPSGGECQVRLTANGIHIETVSIQPGQSAGHSPISGAVALRSAGEVLRIDVVTANSATNVTVVATYTVAND